MDIHIDSVGFISTLPIILELLGIKEKLIKTL